MYLIASNAYDCTRETACFSHGPPEWRRGRTGGRVRTGGREGRGGALRAGEDGRDRTSEKRSRSGRIRGRTAAARSKVFRRVRRSKRSKLHSGTRNRTAERGVGRDAVPGERESSGEREPRARVEGDGDRTAEERIGGEDESENGVTG